MRRRDSVHCEHQCLPFCFPLPTAPFPTAPVRVARLSRSYEASGLGTAELSCGHVDVFRAFQRGSMVVIGPSGPVRACGACWTCWAGWGCRRSTSRVESSPTEVLLARFERHLLAERGLAPGTVKVKGYVRRARRFLDSLSPGNGLTAVRAGT